MQPSPVVPPIWPTAGKADSFASGGDIWAHMKLGGVRGAAARQFGRVLVRKAKAVAKPSWAIVWPAPSMTCP